MKRPLSHDAATFDRLPGELARYERDLDRRFEEAEPNEALAARLRQKPAPPIVVHPPGESR